MNQRNYQKELDKVIDGLVKREPGAKSVAAQLLRSMQQLCAGISVPVF